MKITTNIVNPLRPRIRLTSFCNRHCSYCFARDYLKTERDKMEISLFDMERILKLCADEGITLVGWQGGEPLLHSNIEAIINLQKKYNVSVMLFSNALVDLEKMKNLKDVVRQVLINCNEPSTYSQEEWLLLNKNIDLFAEYLGQKNVALGINVYKSDMDTEFIVDLAVKHQIHEVRIDMTRPAPSHENVFVEFDKIRELLPVLTDLIDKLSEKGIEVPHFDCPFPICMLNDREKEYVSKYMYDDYKYGMCRTSLDFTTDSKLSSCFCSIPMNNIIIEDFDGLFHAWLCIEYYENIIRWERCTIDRCNSCQYHEQRICQGGCLGFKISKAEYISKSTLFSTLERLPHNYLNRLAKAYGYFFTRNYELCLLIVTQLHNEYYYDRTEWLFIMCSLIVHEEVNMPAIEEFIKNNSYPAVRGVDLASVLYEQEKYRECYEVLSFTYDLCDNRSIGYKKLVLACINITKKLGRFNRLADYVKALAANTHSS